MSMQNRVSYSHHCCAMEFLSVYPPTLAEYEVSSHQAFSVHSQHLVCIRLSPCGNGPARHHKHSSGHEGGVMSRCALSVVAWNDCLTRPAEMVVTGIAINAN